MCGGRSWRRHLVDVFNMWPSAVDPSSSAQARQIMPMGNQAPVEGKGQSCILHAS